ncbi:TrpR like protein, YerC/YecD [Patescibacteria group bacterium]|nr:MAG: TrpR like protein, YerC/YecD [Patescibacteria group bacterium]
MNNVTKITRAPRNPKQDMVALYDAFLSLKTREECAAFLRDLCTQSELEAFTERFAIARLLAKDVSYRDTADETGASTTTVTRVSHWLHHGQGGYRSVITRLNKK